MNSICDVFLLFTIYILERYIDYSEVIVWKIAES